MENLDPKTVIVQFKRLAAAQGGSAPRRYSAARLQQEEAVQLTIGPSYEQLQAPATTQDGEALFAEWRTDENGAALHVFCGTHMADAADDQCHGQPELIRRFLQAVRYADRHLFSAYPFLDEAQVLVHCAGPRVASSGQRWGMVTDFRLPELQRGSPWTQFELPTWQSLAGAYDPI